ncbi:hypothetical protein SEA_CRICKO_76 [Streptomyces phage CricKo]|nr:hypothetical protein SEA_RAINYDAI_73 [Streptomyces phage Rainydai]QJD49959.1 hypothetical protein SEA_CRICKO_76 [Streptomyces phage CricKo]QNL30691.1 hypothetical protein SEA_THIQQUMS_76 [Streptomyces phage Thiqqums]
MNESNIIAVVLIVSAGVIAAAAGIDAGLSWWSERPAKPKKAKYVATMPRKIPTCSTSQQNLETLELGLMRIQQRMHRSHGAHRRIKTG